ncbi:MAG: hypothetical protein LBJ21_06785, partial [Acidobacteriota bacterium]|nr:hypothetical protein [Acidobacteriota bacterium]
RLMAGGTERHKTACNTTKANYSNRREPEGTRLLSFSAVWINENMSDMKYRRPATQRRRREKTVPG